MCSLTDCQPTEKYVESGSKVHDLYPAVYLPFFSFVGGTRCTRFHPWFTQRVCAGHKRQRAESQTVWPIFTTLTVPKTFKTFNRRDSPLTHFAWMTQWATIHTLDTRLIGRTYTTGCRSVYPARCLGTARGHTLAFCGGGAELTLLASAR